MDVEKFCSEPIESIPQRNINNKFNGDEARKEMDEVSKFNFVQLVQYLIMTNKVSYSNYL